MKTKVSKYNILFRENQNAYIFNSLSNALFEINQELSNQLSSDFKNPTMADMDYYSEYPQLHEYSIITTDDNEKKEINKIRLNSFIERFDKSVMSLTIAPTSYCNFNCPYCYEKNRLKQFMNNDTANKLVDFISQQNQLKRLGIMWYGGEPLLNFKMIKELTRRFQNMDLNYSAGIVTNGYLLNRYVADRLSELNIGYIQITLDGPREIHDSRRFHVRSNKSFDKIISNIDYVLSINKDVHINIRVNIDKTNEDSFPQLVEFIKERYAGNSNLGITPSYVHDVASLNNCHFDRMNKAIFRLKYKDLDVFDFYPQKQLAAICIARHVNSYLIDADGGIYKCYNDIGIREKQIANLHGKSINTELLTSYLVEADYLSDPTCMDCNLMPVCSGGCPYDRINKNENDPKGNCVTIKDFEKEFLTTHIRLKALWQQKQV